MRVVVACPIDESPLDLWVDDKGDPSVGIQPQGIEDISGPCPHAAEYGLAIEANGEDQLKLDYPALWARIEREQDRLNAEENARYEAMARAQDADEQWARAYYESEGHPRIGGPEDR